MNQFTQGAFTFILVTMRDVPLLHKWLNTPHVSENWDGPCSLDEVSKKYQKKLSSFLEGSYLVEISGKRFAYISYYKAGKSGNGCWPTEPAGTLGIDQFIAIEALLNKGLGSSMISSFTSWLEKEFSPSKILADPKPGNLRAIRAYEKAGFKQRGLSGSPERQVMLMEKTADN